MRGRRRAPGAARGDAAVIGRADCAAWFDTRNDVAALRSLLRPCPAAEMEAVSVSPLVNSPENNGPQLLAPAE